MLEEKNEKRMEKKSTISAMMKNTIRRTGDVSGVIETKKWCSLFFQYTTREKMERMV